MKKIISKIVLESDTKIGRIFDIFIQSLIILSLLSISVESLPNLTQNQREIINIFEEISLIIFAVEFFIRLFFTKPFTKYLFSFFGIVDLIAILPFFLSTGIDLRSARIFRLFRIFRIFKLLKYNTAINRLQTAFLEIKNELIIFLIGTLFLLYISAIGIYYFESEVQPEHFKSVFHSLWWAVTTLTTVGYGDMYPITIGGKIFTTFVVFIGMGMVAVPTGLFASALSKSFKKNNE